MTNINKFISWTSNAEETIIINTLTQKCIVLDDTGKILWNLILDGNNEANTAKICIENFESSDESLIRNDIHDFFQLLVENDVLENSKNVK